MIKVFNSNPTYLCFYGPNGKVHPTKVDYPLWSWPLYMIQTHIQVNYCIDVSIPEIVAIKDYLSLASAVVYSLRAMELQQRLGEQ